MLYLTNYNLTLENEGYVNLKEEKTAGGLKMRVISVVGVGGWKEGLYEGGEGMAREVMAREGSGESLH